MRYPVDNDNGGFWFVLGWYNSLLFLEPIKKTVLESSNINLSIENIEFRNHRILVFNNLSGSMDPKKLK